MMSNGGDLSDDEQIINKKLNFMTPQKQNNSDWQKYSTGDDYSRKLFSSNKKIFDEPQIC